MIEILSNFARQCFGNFFTRGGYAQHVMPTKEINEAIACISKDFEISPSEMLRELTFMVSKLECCKNELTGIRATLLLNFGDTKHNKYGFTISEKDGSTERLLVLVLDKLCHQVSRYREIASVNGIEENNV